ncbi:MAG: NAD-dependent epimerase/dehydratase family protein [Methylobacteriaceae bacterium]|nr:NAD-dependent epimerase/dehydratase family protein [Methylobacteriaceae bacterium]
MRFILTGTAGFIGFHLASRLLEEGHEVAGIDGFTPYYEVSLKESRNALLEAYPRFQSHRVMLEDRAALERIWSLAPDIVVHLAAQAGVRYSLENPRAYIDANLIGTFNVMEMVRARPVRHFMLASTSSVYGASPTVPFRETDRADHPLTLYAATKKATELMAHTYSHLWDIPTTAFRFFTVYGPWGRPDMAPSRFVRGVIEGTPIEVYNRGDMARDFTYVDDLVEAVVRLSACVPRRPDSPAEIEAGDSLSPDAPFRVVNIGAGEPASLVAFIEAIEAAVGKPSVRALKPMQPGDVPRTFASVDLLERLTGYRPATPLAAGIGAFVAWYRDYHKI